MPGSPLEMLLGLSWQQADQATSSKNLPSFMFLGVFMAVLLTPSGCLVGLSQQNQTMLHMALCITCNWVTLDGQRTCPTDEA